MILPLLNQIPMFSFNVVSQYREVVLWIVRYFKAHPGNRLLYTANSHLYLKAFTDSDSAGSPIDRISTIG